ncbi:Holliday junction ATP-dependent DNA helicase RuvA [Leifsonia xyli subsp. xyli]|uniref:Holliday junction branch migration complex subunit RuvA n=2 Tax=Leifsonia xyli subsp. xyli TaxID=59736 RepID=RUVA_LEIXX|nr:Holliday junction branch migration protein RuvA [Leifsonia xyli]Q6AFB5.1 RecName: Full=Holliday junction branch migration complex subunit RuvA [Leifsonia xyli subsp. xyli str. CTCB07]AAT88930.1 holliday junction DNA helicase [Leifsonia xyli subsp. xyli str. CTCB07]ODA90416.1 Holliday junction ATP-dependent DNA helicase RuvA [Leifsonia xyli subsp. xyli]
MISSLRGTVLSASGGAAVIDVGGVGFAVQLTPDHARSLRVGDEAFVHTTLIVREDSLQLFGFSGLEQLQVFELLNGVSGVGPKSAISVLSVLSPDQVADAVAAADDAPFRAVSGIGPKTAKLIVVSLTGKLAACRRPSAPSARRPSAPSSVSDSVLVALVGLGWPEKVAGEAVAEVIAGTAESERDSVQTLLRLTLARLGPANQAAR